MNTFAKIILGNVFRNLLTALITFFVTKSVIEADVASKLMRGDTTELWPGSGISVNLTMIVNILIGISAPIAIPIGLGIWSRVKHAYETIVARSQQFAASKEEIKAIIAETPAVTIINAVASEKPTS